MVSIWTPLMRPTLRRYRFDLAAIFHLHKRNKEGKKKVSTNCFENGEVSVIEIRNKTFFVSVEEHSNWFAVRVGAFRRLWRGKRRPNYFARWCFLIVTKLREFPVAMPTSPSIQSESQATVTEIIDSVMNISEPLHSQRHETMKE